MVEIYALDLSLLPSDGEEEYENLWVQLSDYRKQRIQTCKHPETRKQLFGAGILLNRILKHKGINPKTVRIGEHGKPEVEGIYFNLSHSGNLVICATSRLPVGCDAEQVRPESGKLAERFFSEKEKAYLKGFDQLSYDREFCRLWTAKESFVKMTGEGLHLSLHTEEVQVGDTLEIWREGKKENCRLKEYDVPGYCVTVCAKEEQFLELQWEIF